MGTQGITFSMDISDGCAIMKEDMAENGRAIKKDDSRQPEHPPAKAGS